MKHLFTIILTFLILLSMNAQHMSQVWDFGGDSITGMQNMLSEKEINSWFPSYPSGTMSAALLSFQASDSVNLRYYAHGAHNHRLRTINPRLTHTDEKSGKDDKGHIYRGFIYSNSDSNPDVYIEQSFQKGDTIAYYLCSNGGKEIYRFYLSDSSYYDTCHYNGNGVEKHIFICPKNGKYRLCGIDEKLVVARIIRYPLATQLSKKENRELNKKAHHPIRKQKEKHLYKTDFPNKKQLPEIPYRETLYVNGSISEAIDSVRHMKRDKEQRVTILIPPGNYEEMIRIDLNNITLKNASAHPSIGLRNAGVDIEQEAVRITGYYGCGYNYGSMNSQYIYDERTLKNARKHFPKTKKIAVWNKGGSVTSYWNATTIVTGKNFKAENIIFENSFNQYICHKESEDIEEVQNTKPVRPKNYGNTLVQERIYRERAAAIAFADSASAELTNCRIVSRQDAFFGDHGTRIRVNEGIIMGGVDFIYGGMNLVCKKTELVLLTSSKKGDVAYITAAQTSDTKRGMLFWECTIRSAIPHIEMADSIRAQNGYLGRPWSKSGETVFVRTRIMNGEDEKPIICPQGWSDGLTGVGAPRSYEYGSHDIQGSPINTHERAEWATTLVEPILPDRTIINPENW